MTRRDYFSDWPKGNGCGRRTMLADAVPFMGLAHAMFHLAINASSPDLKRLFFRIARESI